MRRSFIILSYFVGLGIGLVPFTNCDSYTESEAFRALNSTDEDGNSPLSCNGGTCTLGSPAEQIRLEVTASQLNLSGMGEFVFGGQCSVGPFYANKVVWQIFPLNQTTPYSDVTGPYTSVSRCGPGQACGANQYGKCQSELFSVRLVLPQTPGTYEVQLDLEGFNEYGDVFTNNLTGRKRITLVIQ